MDIVKTRFPEKSIDLYDSLDLVKSVIEDTLDSVRKSLDIAYTNKHYDDAQLLLEVAKSSKPFILDIDKILRHLEIDEVNHDEEKSEEEERRIISNYEDYVVDNRTEHTLYENFTFKRPFGFCYKGNEKLVKVNTWHNMLLVVCTDLYKSNTDMFKSFESDKSMNGRKKKYFSKDKTNMRVPVLISNDIYIETNLSSNSIRNLIVKLLKKYKLSIEQFKVYFRADYSSMKEAGS
ncbi:hypothetical protein [Sporolactobacillus vineae]|nr:hypothetical protein [Sporolactobacillus vineae]